MTIEIDDHVFRPGSEPPEARPGIAFFTWNDNEIMQSSYDELSDVLSFPPPQKFIGYAYCDDLNILAHRALIK